MADMISNPAAAASAYANMAKSAVSTGDSQSESDTVSKVSFGNILENTARNAIDTMKAGERASASGIAGTMDPLAVTQAVTAAKLTLETVVAVRDAAVEAYNKIQGMPI